jgi:putative transposase
MENVATYALESAVCEHIHLNVYLVDDTTKTPLGTPWITVIYDSYSWLILGIYIEFTPPTNNSVLCALKNAILPKIYINEKYPNIVNDWVAYGIPQQLRINKGKEFFVKHLEEVCENLGINLLYSPPRKDEIIIELERFFRLLNQELIHKKTGCAFLNVFNERKCNQKNNAVISLKEFSQIIHHWLIDVFSTSYFRGLKGIPKSLWEKSIENFPPHLPPDKTGIDLLFGTRTSRTIQKTGIQLHHLHYNSSELQLKRKESIIRKKQSNADIKFNPDDLSKIYVFDQFQKSFFEVPCLVQEYSKNLTLDTHLLILEEARKHTKKVDVESIKKAREQIQKIIELSLKDNATYIKGRQKGK